jgi:hypothetical protein
MKSFGYFHIAKKLVVLSVLILATIAIGLGETNSVRAEKTECDFQQVQSCYFQGFYTNEFTCECEGCVAHPTDCQEIGMTLNQQTCECVSDSFPCSQASKDMCLSVGGRWNDSLCTCALGK